MLILGKEGPHLKETDNSSVCFRAGGAGGHGSTNDSSPEVQSETDFLQVPTQISFIFLCQGDFKVSVDCDGSKNIVNLEFFCWS